MKRNVELSEISDGKLYTANDMVKADCRDCEGCSACCRNMGNSLQLDPYACKEGVDWILRHSWRNILSSM